MSTPDPATRDRSSWLRYVQQEGLVLSPTALLDASVGLGQDTLLVRERFSAIGALSLEDMHRDATRHLTL